MVLKRVPDSSMFASDPTKSSSMRPNLKLKQINLLRGWPSTQLLPASLLKEGAQNVLSQTYNNHTNDKNTAQSGNSSSRPIDYDSLSLAEQSMLYGPDGGHQPLRVALGRWFQSFYGPATSRAYPKAFQQKFATSNSLRQNGRPREAQTNYDIPYDRIALTGGASQSLGVVMTALTDPTYTRKIWIVAPGYFLAFNIFRDAGFAGKDRLAAIPELALNPGKHQQSLSGRGPDVSWLRRALEQCESDWKKNGGASEPQLKPYPAYKKIYKHIIYMVPSFSNPSSITSTLNVREDLVRCARDFDALVICDDVYDMLQWPARTSMPTSSSNEDLDIAPLPRLVDIDRLLERDSSLDQAESEIYGNVVSNGTFSKIAGPGCRVGWVEAAPDLALAISQAATTKSGGSPGHLVSTFLSDMLERGSLQRHVKEVLRPAYAERWAAMVRVIDEELVPLGVEMPHPHGDDITADGDNVISKVPRAGGYFIWLALPKRIIASELVKRAIEEENVIVAGGKLFQVPDVDRVENYFEGYIRLCFAWEALPELKAGVYRLAKVLKKMLAEEASGTSSRTIHRSSRRDSFSGYA